jgi:hypothetical protein
MIGASQQTNGTNPQSLNITTTENNSGILLACMGGNDDSGATLTGYTLDNINNTQRRVFTFRNNDVGSAGSKTLSPTQGDWLWGVEVKAAAGGGGVPKSNKLCLMGVG